VAVVQASWPRQGHADLTLDVPPPPGVAVQAVADEQGVELATTTPFMHPGGAVS
jgi:hypothetical protein